MVWFDHRSGNYDIYVQRIDAAGIPLWTANGVAISATADEVGFPRLISDGSGGAIIAWLEYSGLGIVRAQRVSSSGVPLWTADGVDLLVTGTDPAIVTDGSGGAIVVTGGENVVGQRINALGVPEWLPNGSVVCNAANGQWELRAASDGSGGAVVAWEDYRNDPGLSSTDLYAQRINGSGIAQWTANGVPISAAANSQQYLSMVGDGSGGAIFTWSDVRDGDEHIYAQKLNGVGAAQWTVDGAAVCTATNYQQEPVLALDASGGAIIVWGDYRNPTLPLVYAQRMNGAGTPQWAANGVIVANSGFPQVAPAVTSDGSGGALIAYQELYDIHAQRIDAAGLAKWTAAGLRVSDTGFSFQTVIAPAGSGGALIAWAQQTGIEDDIYAQRMTDADVAVAITSFEAVASDGFVALRGRLRSDFGVETVNVYRASDGERRLIAQLHGTWSDQFEYVDRSVEPGRTYRYQIGVMDADGEFLSPIASIRLDPVALELAQNRPNPFNPATTIRFVLASREHVTLTVFNADGARIRTLVDETLGLGAHDVAWDGRDENRVAVGSGVYFYRLEAGKQTRTRKMVLLK